MMFHRVAEGLSLQGKPSGRALGAPPKAGLRVFKIFISLDKIDFIV